MAISAFVRVTAVLLLLVFPVQLLALAYLPCRHAAVPADGHLDTSRPHCHAGVDAAGQVRAVERDPGAPLLPDCGKCQMETVFSAMHGADPVENRVSNPTPPILSERPPFFYHLYPDSPERPPRTGL